MCRYDTTRDGNEVVSKVGGCAKRSTGLGSDIVENGSVRILRTVKMEGKGGFGPGSEGSVRVWGHLTVSTDNDEH